MDTNIIAQTSGAGQPASSLVLCAISHRAPSDDEKHYELSAHADMLRITYTSPVKAEKRGFSGGHRSTIKTFSKKSRKRLIERLACKRDYVRPLFITLTYNDAVLTAGFTSRTMKGHVDALAKRLFRRWSGAGLIWKIELKRRLTGSLAGTVAPHLHLIVDGITDDLAYVRRWFWSAWADITSSGAVRSRVDVDPAKSRKHAMYYVSKYVAKSEEDEQAISEFFHNYGAVGRWWGIAGQWDETAAFVVRLTRAEFVALRRAVVGWLKSRGSRYAKRLKGAFVSAGFTVFGLGDMSSDAWGHWTESTVFRMVNGVTAAAG